jgi:tetratricopeptide (TPR) repeat protein
MWSSVALAALLFQPAATANPNWQSEGLRALEQKDYPAAIAALEKAVNADPKDFAVRFNLALAYSLTDRDREAIGEYRKTLEIKPDLYEANLNLGILLLRNKQANAAVEVLRRASTAKPSEARPALYLADALFNAGEYVEAGSAYEAVLKLDEKSAGAELGLARVKTREGDVAGAAAHFENAARLEPAYQDALLELADLYEANKKTQEAASIYARFPDNPAAQERAGEILLADGKAAEAIPHLEFAVQSSPTSANRLALATAFFATKDVEKGVTTLNQALTADPKNFAARMLAGRVLRDHKRYADAAAHFLEAASIQPEAREPWGELATISVLAENFPQAIAALDRVKALGGETTSHLYLRAIILDRMKQYQPALENYQRFLSAAAGKFPEEEFKSRQRVRIIQKELSKR